MKKETAIIVGEEIIIKEFNVTPYLLSISAGLIILKLFGVINWSWLAVTSPIWGMYLFGAVAVVLCMTFGFQESEEND